MHALSARAADAPALARARRGHRHQRRGRGPPGRARARVARPRQPPRDRGRLPLPVHVRRGRLPPRRHALLADAARPGRARARPVAGWGHHPGTGGSFGGRLGDGPMSERSDGRAPGDLRPTRIDPGFVSTATGSALITQGETRVICTASVQESVPRWMAGQGRGGVTGEYGLLPASPGDRKQRDVPKGRLDGRSVEIQRLIGRSLRGVIDFSALGERTIYLDCDVLTADGGTRCASITGAFVALDLACRRLVSERRLERTPLTGTVAAVSCGMV